MSKEDLIKLVSAHLKGAIKAVANDHPEWNFSKEATGSIAKRAASSLLNDLQKIYNKE